RQNFWKKYLPVGIKADKFGDVHIYPFPLTWISELLRLNKMSNEDHENFVNIVEYVLDWLDKNERIAYGTKSPIPIREKAYIGKFSGWRSPQSVYPRGNPESWSTSLVFDSLWRMRRKIKKVLSNEIIKYFNGTIGNEKLAEEKFVTRRDSDIFFDNITHKYSLKKIIFYNIIEPRL